MRMAVQAPLLALLLLVGLVNVHIPLVDGFVAIARTTSHHCPRDRVPVSQSALVLSDVDTMTLNWIGLAVGTMASLWVYQMDRNQETINVSIPSSQEQKKQVLATVAAPSVVPKIETTTSTTTTTTTAVVKPVAAPTKPVVDEAPPASKPAVIAKVKATAATKVMKETQKEIQQKLQQVSDKLQSTSATSQNEAPVYTEPYSDKVKKSVKRKSRWVGKLTKKVLMPWKAWKDL